MFEVFGAKSAFFRATCGLLLLGAFSAPALAAGAAEAKYRDAAILAARWIRTCAIADASGKTWLPDPADKRRMDNSLYAGTAGITLFYLEIYRMMNDQVALEEGKQGADYLLATLDKEKQAGLYDGMAGIGFTLNEAFKITKQKKYRDGAVRCVAWLKEHAAKTGNGVQWNVSTDILSGSAGIGLFLLYAAKEKLTPDSRDLAVQAGQRLLERAQPEAGGLKWKRDDSTPGQMPNFSHGTAGVAYFLATLYSETRQKSFLEAAVAGAKYLQSVADRTGDGCLIFHDDAEGKNLTYLGWCHGPAGTARLFTRLHKVTGDSMWLDWVKRSAKSVLTSGIPEKETPGFWKNVGQCCGTAGVAAFFLDLYRVVRDKAYLDFARRLTDSLLAKGTPDKDSSGNDTMKWVHAEYRTKPEQRAAQSGYMQGAAGIGMCLLQMDAFERGKPPGIRLPDNPF